MVLIMFIIIATLFACEMSDSEIDELDKRLGKKIKIVKWRN